MPHEVSRVGAGVGGDVEGLVGAHAGHRAAGDVANRVSAGLPGGEADVPQDAHRLRGVFQLDVMKLNVLARRHVSLMQWSKALRYYAESVELVGRYSAEGHLDPEHLRIRLPLAVDALSEPEGGELVRVPFSRLEPPGLLLEVGYLLRQHLDYPLCSRPPLSLDHLIDSPLFVYRNAGALGIRYLAKIKRPAQKVERGAKIRS